MKRQSKYNVIVTVILMCFASLSANAFCVDGLYYNILSEKEHTVKVTNRSVLHHGAVWGDCVIPEKILYNHTAYTVISIDECAFSQCHLLTSVEIPNSVTSIGGYAFSDCSSLTSVEIPNSVTSIGQDAFCGCSGLVEINVDAANPNYASDAGILYSKDKTILETCPDGKKGEIVIPNSVTLIGKYAFWGCSGLVEINVDAANPNYASDAGILYSKDKTSLVICPGGKKGEIVIPNSVTTIGEDAFRECNGLTSVTIGNSVTSIGEYAFWGCSGLTSLTIPNSVTTIGGFAFSHCYGLKVVTIPNSVDSIGEAAFNACSGLKLVRCHWAEPIECSPGFPAEVPWHEVLYVPKGCTAAYEKVDPWRNFRNIVEIDYSAGVDTVVGDGVEVKVVDGAVVAYGCDEMEVYSMNGQLVYRGSGRADNLAPGIYAVRVGGKTVKVMVGR